MCSKKKDLEIICDLQWKHKPHNGVGKSSIIGVYDVPSTTLSWEKFKSYLLKNSGTTGDDVKVTFLPTNETEFPIQSQLDFQIALYSFREKARRGEIINLQLDRVSDKNKSPKGSTSIDVQTQCSSDGTRSAQLMTNLDKAPQWFTTFMSEFKKDILLEVSATVASYVSAMKPHGVQPYHSRKSKSESVKRSRKHPILLCEAGNEKEFLKTIKLEKKVETKLEKLENKSKKLKEKKMSLLTKSSDSDAGQSSSKSNSDTILSFSDKMIKPEGTPSFDINQMNAAPLRYQQPLVPHMIGGEVYLHTWEVINNGQLPWTADTQLHFIWGSALLEPVEKVVPCPPLKPGETGSINVLLNVPKTCGQYESYWYFHHNGVKFGHWLGCQIIVDKINSAEPLSNSFLNTYDHLKTWYDSNTMIFNKRTNCNISRNEFADKNIFEVTRKTKQLNDEQSQTPQIPTIEKKMKDLEIAEATSSLENSKAAVKGPEEFIFVTHAPCSSSNEVPKKQETNFPTEIEQVVLNASPSKFQLVDKFLHDFFPNMTDRSNFVDTATDFKQPNQNKQIDGASESDDNNNNTEGAQDSSSESISKIDEDATSNSTLNDMVMVNFGDEIEEQNLGYAYVLVDGTKVPIPKKFLRPDFLETAEDAPDPSESEKTTKNQNRVITDAKSEGQNQLTNMPLHENSEAEITSTQIIKSCTPESSSSTRRASEVTYVFLSEKAKKVDESIFSDPPVTVSNNPESAERTSMQDGKRKFVFPQNCPGFEVISDGIDYSGEKKKWPCSNTQYSLSNDDGCNDKFMKCNIYTQDRSHTNLHYYHPRQQTEVLNVDSPPLFMSSSAVLEHYAQQRPMNDSQFSMNESITYPHVPNYQQTPIELRPTFTNEQGHDVTETNGANDSNTTGYSFTCSSGNTYTIPEDKPCPQKTAPIPTPSAPMASVVSGAMTMASSALNTAKNVVNRIIPPRNETESGVWVNGHWIVTNPESNREANLKALAEMGFWDRDLNATLLARYNDDIAQVVTELIQ